MLSCAFSRDRCALCRARLRHHRNNTVRVTLITRATDHPYHPPGLRDNNDNGTVAIPKSTPPYQGTGAQPQHPSSDSTRQHWDEERYWEKKGKQYGQFLARTDVRSHHGPRGNSSQLEDKDVRLSR